MHTDKGSEKDLLVLLFVSWAHFIISNDCPWVPLSMCKIFVSSNFQKYKDYEAQDGPLNAFSLCTIVAHAADIVGVVILKGRDVISHPQTAAAILWLVAKKLIKCPILCSIIFGQGPKKAAHCKVLQKGLN